MTEAFDIYKFLWYFMVYSFLGWCVEVVFCAVTTGKVVNRGFLNGPLCPIYGFGMVAILGFFDHLMLVLGAEGKSNAFMLFWGGVFITTAIELFGGWALDKLFHIRWWDYSDKPFNFHGYICPEFSFFWGIGTVFVYRIIQPTVAGLTVNLFPKSVGIILLICAYAVFAADLAVTVAILIGLNKRLKELDVLKNDMRRFSDELSDRLGERAIKNANKVERSKVQAALAAMEAREEIDEELELKKQEAIVRCRELLEKNTAAAEKYEKLREKIYHNRVFGVSRLVRSFPKASHRHYGELFDKIKDTVNRHIEQST